jgi:hypothetical protein
MKHLGIVVALLVTAVSVTAASQSNGVSVESTSVANTEEIERPAQGRRSEQLRTEINQVVNNLPSELSSRSQRREFASVIKRLLDKRVAANVHGYEQTPRFKRELEQAYARFVDTLESGSPNFRQGEIDEFARISISAFERNEEQFQSFYEKHIKPDPQLKDMSLAEARKWLLQFSAWLYINDQVRWREFIRITFCWPWCHSPRDRPVVIFRRKQFLFRQSNSFN